MKKIRNKFDPHRLFYNKPFLISASILISFIAWLVVTLNQNPTREQTFTGVSANISVENTAVSDLGLGIVNDYSKQKFSVTVKGPNYVVSSLKSEDFLISADLSNVTAPGKYTLKLNGSRNSSASDYTFSSISPATIDLTFDYFDTKDFTLNPKLLGVSAADGLIAEKPIVSNSDQNVITVKGPRSEMSKIASVSALCNVDKTLSQTQTFESDIAIYGADEKILYRYTVDGKILDANENEISQSPLTLSFQSVKVTQPISKKKDVSVNVSLTNIPDGLTLSDFAYKIDHTTVTVIGAPNVVDSMNTLSLADIDVRTISPDKASFDVAAKLPEGVKLFDSIETFKVDFDLSGFKTAVFTVSDLRFENLGEGLNAKKNSYIKNVIICGKENEIASIKNNNVYAVIDLKDSAVGDHTIEAEIHVEGVNGVWQVGYYTASVSIK